MQLGPQRLSIVLLQMRRFYCKQDIVIKSSIILKNNLCNSVDMTDRDSLANETVSSADELNINKNISDDWMHIGRSEATLMKFHS